MVSEVAITYKDKSGIAMSYEEFLKFREKNVGDGNTYEYIDGYMFGVDSLFSSKIFEGLEFKARELYKPLNFLLGNII